MSAWTAPDAAAAPATRLGPDLPVQVLERNGAWARVACSNGWTGWVDGRFLLVSGATQIAAPAPAPARAAAPQMVPVAPAVTRSTPPPARTGPLPPGLSPLVVLGGALAVVGGFLPWLSISGISVTAWDIPLGAILPGVDPGWGPKLGPLLLVAVLVLLPLLTRRRLPLALRVLVAVVAVNAAGGTLMMGLRSDPRLNPGIGLVMTLVGGLLVGFGDLDLGPEPARARAPAATPGR